MACQMNKKPDEKPAPQISLNPCVQNDGLHLGDIYSDVEFLEWMDESEDRSTIKSSTLVFPLAVVMGQECDLAGDSALRAKVPPSGRERPKKANAFMWTTLMLPLYNASQFFDLSNSCLSGVFEDVYLGTATEPTNVSLEMNHPPSPDLVRENQDERYQFLRFPVSSGIPDCVIDFKHYFALRTSYLISCRTKQCLGTLPTLYRERVLQRFTFYLSRIGLPDKLEL